MRGKVFAAVFVLLVAGILAGCGGGGGSNNTSLHGKVYLCQATEHPRLAIVESDGSGGWYTLKCISLSKPSNYWDDVSFKIGLPSWHNGRVCVAVVFNDYNGNNQYDNWNEEVLGFMDGYVVGDSSKDRWYLVDDNLNFVGDVADYSAYIICDFDRSVSGDVNKVKLDKLAELLKKVSPAMP